ncbi:hypothetical protein BDV96DRAFT_599211 [Lophiotrema nucula]|uniref:Uncharacterized protein n=1 Tax=Lophiotrema nucula TaxID=690887 RepID=A0A6A5ZB11_9PLEO|nr:hypothetical protein BDV96DRAFT_599211 [Lophiotrema nucula]
MEPTKQWKPRKMKGAPAALLEWKMPVAATEPVGAGGPSMGSLPFELANASRTSSQQVATNGSLDGRCSAHDKQSITRRPESETKAKHARSKPQPIDVPLPRGGRVCSPDYGSEQGNTSRTLLLPIRESPEYAAVPRSHTPKTPSRAQMPLSPGAPGHQRNRSSQNLQANIEGYTPVSERPLTFESFRPYQSNAGRSFSMTSLITAPGNICDKTNAAATQSVLAIPPEKRARDAAKKKEERSSRHRRKRSAAEKFKGLFKGK